MYANARQANRGTDVIFEAQVTPGLDETRKNWAGVGRRELLPGVPQSPPSLEQAGIIALPIPFNEEKRLSGPGIADPPCLSSKIDRCRPCLIHMYQFFGPWTIQSPELVLCHLFPPQEGGGEGCVKAQEFLNAAGFVHDAIHLESDHADVSLRVKRSGKTPSLMRLSWIQAWLACTCSFDCHRRAKKFLI